MICGDNEKGEMVSLSDKQIIKYYERFKEPEFYTAEEVEDAILIEVYSFEDEEEREV